MSDGGSSMDELALSVARRCKGFLDEEEGLRLYSLARYHAHLGPVVEIGSYCGKSSVYLGTGAQCAGGSLICIDHHRGNEEQQPGEEYHDPEVYDHEARRIDTLPYLRRTIREAGLEEVAILIVGRSVDVARLCLAPPGMVFIDGGHSRDAAHADYEAWARKVAAGGVLAIHDLFPDSTQGGQAPIEIYRLALGSGEYEELPATKTLGVLRRRA